METTDGNNNTDSSSTKTISTSPVEKDNTMVPPITPPQIPKPYTLRQAFIKKCLRECQRDAPRASLEEDMLLTGLTNNDKQAIISHYEYRNNPMSSLDVPPPFNKYYLQYHVFDLVVFKKYAKQAWNDVIQYLNTTKIWRRNTPKI